MVFGLFRHLCPQFIPMLVHAGSKKLYLSTLFLKKTTLGHLVFLISKFHRPRLINIIIFWLYNFKNIKYLSLKFKCFQINFGKQFIGQQHCTGYVREVLKLTGLESVKDMESLVSRLASCSYYNNTFLLYTC